MFVVKLLYRKKGGHCLFSLKAREPIEISTN
jgi:hypothetical protein